MTYVIGKEKNHTGGRVGGRRNYCYLSVEIYGEEPVNSKFVKII